MDEIWDRNTSKSEVIGLCGGDGKNEWSRKTDKSRTLEKRKKNSLKSQATTLTITFVK